MIIRKVVTSKIFKENEAIYYDTEKDCFFTFDTDFKTMDEYEKVKLVFAKFLVLWVLIPFLYYRLTYGKSAVIPIENVFQYPMLTTIVIIVLDVFFCIIGTIILMNIYHNKHNVSIQYLTKKYYNDSFSSWFVKRTLAFLLILSALILFAYSLAKQKDATLLIGLLLLLNLIILGIYPYFTNLYFIYNYYRGKFKHLQKIWDEPESTEAEQLENQEESVANE